MTRAPGLWLLLLWGLLGACASTPGSLREPGEEPVASLEAACEDPRSLVFLCGEEACAFYRCADVAPGRVVRTYSGAPVARPGLSVPGASARRYWGGAQGLLPGDAQPVFVIPWHNEKPQRFLPLFSEEQLRELERARGQPTERHHIFPQEFKAWFKRQGINVHAWTLVLLKEDHDRIHRGASGGPWNAAWRQYKSQNDKAPPEAIWRYAGELIYRFELYGPVIPYYRRTPSPPAAAQ
jgi:uncharacterized lipoprotein (TIGR02269 family)